MLGFIQFFDAAVFELRFNTHASAAGMLVMGVVLVVVLESCVLFVTVFGARLMVSVVGWFSVGCKCLLKKIIAVMMINKPVLI